MAPKKRGASSYSKTPTRAKKAVTEEDEESEEEEEDSKKKVSKDNEASSSSSSEEDDEEGEYCNGGGVKLTRKERAKFEKKVQELIQETKRLKEERDAAKAKKDRNERKKLNEAQTSQLGTFATTWVWEHLKLLEPGYDSFDKNPEIVQKIFARIGVKEDNRIS